ncbi:MAG: DUF4919 domain-containing protein [Bacteroidales bacterium]|nr:DUF4919 domain-containing protein [Bacteroidales bacterium]
MKTGFLLFLCLVCAPLWGFAQQDGSAGNYDTTEIQRFFVPDYDQIGKVIRDKKSPYYYPKLVKKLANADTTMTIEDLHYLYYGYVLQDDYDPYINLDEENRAHSILNKDYVSVKNAQKALKLLNKAIKKSPTHVRLYFYRYVANTIVYGENSKQAQDDLFRYIALISAIAASGDGMDFETAFHVAIVSHSYSLMSCYGLRSLQQSLQSSDDQMFDVFKLDVNDEGIESLYVNVTPCLNYLSKQFGD